MSMLKEALLKGIDSARTVQKNHAEIQSVIDSVNGELDQIKGSSKVNLVFDKVSSLEQLSFPDITSSGITREKLVITDGKEAFKVALLSRADAGYPCTLIFDNQNIQAMDHSSFAAAIGELLQTHTVGRIILYLKNK